MKSYQDFRKINEAVEPNLLQDLEKQIDALFDELKQKLRNPNVPKSAAEQDWEDFMTQWRKEQAAAKSENKLEQYHAAKKLTEEFHEALIFEADENLDAILDQFKERMKQMVRTFATAYKPPRKPRTPAPVPEPAASPSPAPVVPHAPVVAPSPPANVEEPPREPDTHVPPAPAPAPATHSPVPEPHPVAASKIEPAAPEMNAEDEKLMRLGAAVLFARDINGEADVSPEDVEYAMQQPFNAKAHMANKEVYIKAAREYQQAQSNKGLHAGTSTKDQIEVPPPAEPQPAKEALPESPAPAAPAHHEVTKEDLEAMKPEQFKAWIMEHDPEIAEAYEGMPWWKKHMREEIIDSYLTNKFMREKAAAEQAGKQEESIKYKVSKYKEMLRLENRPTVLLHEAVRMPFSKRVGFYKKKLSCRDTF